MGPGLEVEVEERAKTKEKTAAEVSRVWRA